MVAVADIFWNRDAPVAFLRPGNFSVYGGEQATNGVTWYPNDVSNHDFTILIAPDGHEIFLPFGYIKMISFSSFAVLLMLDSSGHTDAVQDSLR